MFEYLKELSESKAFPSSHRVSGYDAHTLCELAEIYLCSLYILFHTDETKKFARSYASATMTSNNTHFKKWTYSGNDLYIIIHSLVSDIPLEHPHESDQVRKTLPVGMNTLTSWLSQIAHDQLTDSTNSLMFSRMDYNFQVTYPSIRAVRRMVMDWPKLSHEEKQKAMTRLLQLLRYRLPSSELLPKLNFIARHHDWELEDVANKETENTGPGFGNGAAELRAKSEKPKMGLAAKTLALGAGMAISNRLHRHVAEDEGGGDAAPVADAGGATEGSTMSSNIATVVKPLGNVKRR